MKIDKWTSHVQYIDMETGEIITPTNAKQNYIIIKHTKNVEINEILQKGKIQYYKYCKRNPQSKLQFTDH